MSVMMRNGLVTYTDGIRNLTSRFDVPTKAEKEASRQLRQNLPVDELGLPELTGVAVLPDTAFDLEERFQRYKNRSSNTIWQ